MLDLQTNKNISWTPSKLINLIGQKINNENSICYWCYKNKIPVFSPAITDGSIGDMMYFHTCQNKGNPIKLDIVEGMSIYVNIIYSYVYTIYTYILYSI